MAAHSVDAARGYARPTNRSFDPLSGAHVMDRGRLLTDRSAYISFLEVQLERVTSSCLTVQAFSDRIEQLQGQILTLEDKLSNVHKSTRILHQHGESQAGSLSHEHFAISTLTEKVNRLERELFNATKHSSGRSPSPPHTATRNYQTSSFEDEMRSRMREVEMTCNRLADDAMEAVEVMQRKLDDSQKHVDVNHDRKLHDLEARLSNKTAEGIQRVTSVLKRVVTAQKLLQSTQPQVKVSGDVNLKMKDTSPVRIGRPVHAPGSSARTASEPSARRRRALDELMKELELLEQEERHLI